MESHYLDDQAALLRSCGCASCGDAGVKEMREKEAGTETRPAVRGAVSTLFNAMINSRGRTFRICQTHQYFPLHGVFQSG